MAGPIPETSSSSPSSDGRARQIAAETPGAFMINQYDNPKNADAHYQTTGPEVWRRLTPISFAMTCASVVLPNPGGPKIRT